MLTFYKEFTVLDSYHAQAEERCRLGVVPKPLSETDVKELVSLLENPPQGSEQELIDLLENRIPPGVDEAAKVKADFLNAVARGKVSSPLITKTRAVELLGTMQGGYNVSCLIDLLEDPDLGSAAATALSHTNLIFDAFDKVAALADKGSANAAAVIKSWAEGEWFTSRPKLQDKITLTVFKVPGETNTDDLSPAPDAWS